MAYVKYNALEELAKARQGMKTKVPVPILLMQVTKDYPHIQARISVAFNIGK